MLVNQQDFAKIMGVTPKSVSKWKKGGKLVMQDAMVNVEASKARLKQYHRGGGMAASLQGNQGNQGNRREGVKEPAVPMEIERFEGETLDEAAERLVGEVDLNMSLDEARRIKEVYLALLNRLEYEKRSGDVIDLRLARTVLFECARGARDAWLNWPSKYAPYIAADLGLDSDKVLPVLEEHVYKQIAALGLPDGQAFEAGA
jgi:hypothetical protein